MSQGSGGISNNLKNHHHRISAASATANAQSSSSTMTGANAANVAINASGGTPNHSSSDGDDTIHFPYCDDVNKYEKIGKIGQGMKQKRNILRAILINLKNTNFRYIWRSVQSTAFKDKKARCFEEGSDGEWKGRLSNNSTSWNKNSAITKIWKRSQPNWNMPYLFQSTKLQSHILSRIWLSWTWSRRTAFKHQRQIFTRLEIPFVCAVTF